MTNISVDGSILVFRDELARIDDTSEIRCPDYLRHREMAERAAAKKSSKLAVRRIHQQLAQTYAARRRNEQASSDE